MVYNETIIKSRVIKKRQLFWQPKNHPKMGQKIGVKNSKK